MRLGQFAHRDDIAHGMFDRYSAVVLRYIVDAAKDDHVLWLQVQDVLSESHEQFG